MSNIDKSWSLDGYPQVCVRYKPLTNYCIELDYRPAAGTIITEGVVHQVVWVPNVGFVASAPGFGFCITSLNGKTWSPVANELSFGMAPAITHKGRAYVGSYIGNTQVATITAETFPNSYITANAIDRPYPVVNGVAAGPTRLMYVSEGGRVSLVPILPEYDPDDASKPSIVPVVEVTSPANQSATVEWTAPDSAGTSPITSYLVQYTDDGGENWNAITGATTSSPLQRRLTGLTNGKEYMFRVAAVNTSGRGPYSMPSAPYTPTPSSPSPPTAVTAIPVGPLEPAFIGGAQGQYNTRVRLSWAAAADGGSPVTGYIIRRFPHELEIARTGSAATTFTTDPTQTLRMFQPGDSLQFDVIAVNAYGPSPASAPCTAFVLK